MRILDFYIGASLCLLAELACRAKRFFAPNAAAKPRRALFIELTEMGSAVLADPAMRRLRKETGAELFFAIFESNKDALFILETVPEANIFAMRDRSFPLFVLDTFRLLAWMRRNRIDTVIDLEIFSRFTSLLAALSGARNKAGFFRFTAEGLYRGDVLTHRVAYNPHMHISKNFMALVLSLLAEKPQKPFLKARIEDHEVAVQKIHAGAGRRDAVLAAVQSAFPAFQPGRMRLALFNPNAGDLLPQRRWMPENFAAVIRLVLDNYPDALALLTGSERERDYAARVRSMAGAERCVNFAGAVPLRDLPVLCSMANMMLTNDSGPAHFASVTDLPVCVIFGPETPALYGPLGNARAVYAGLACSPCVNAANHRRTCCSEMACLEAIKPDAVFEMLREFLDAPPPLPRGAE